MPTPTRAFPRRRRVRKSLRPVLDVVQDLNYIEGDFGDHGGVAPRFPLLLVYRVKATDIVVATLMNPRHGTIRCCEAGGPARALAPFIDAGYTFSPLRQIDHKYTHVWAIKRLPKNIELHGYRNIVSTPDT